MAGNYTNFFKFFSKELDLHFCTHAAFKNKGKYMYQSAHTRT
jgi:hypothetical protein